MISNIRLGKGISRLSIGDLMGRLSPLGPHPQGERVTQRKHLASLIHKHGTILLDAGLEISLWGVEMQSPDSDKLMVLLCLHTCLRWSLRWHWNEPIFMGL